MTLNYFIMKTFLYLFLSFGVFLFGCSQNKNSAETSEDTLKTESSIENDNSTITDSAKDKKEIHVIPERLQIQKTFR